ncbi:Ras-related protein Rab-5C, partial [Pseudolycoriella hygida]
EDMTTISSDLTLWLCRSGAVANWLLFNVDKTQAVDALDLLLSDYGEDTSLSEKGVGKTSVIERYISKLSSTDVAPTIGASFHIVKLVLDDTKVKLQVWDTAGQERFRAMAPMYYRNSNAALLIFDISNYNTFVDVKVWVAELQKNVQEPMVLTLIGNKTDLCDERAVSRDEAFLYATSINGNYFETSTVTEQGIEQVFTTTALGLLRLAENRIAGTSIKRYESLDSVAMCGSSLDLLESPQDNLNSVHLGISVDASVEATGGVGRLETPSWSIDHIAHGYEHKLGWCCY